MLFEWLESRRTPAPAWAREFGLVHEAISIPQRKKRTKNAWDEHCERTKQTILEAAWKAHSLFTEKKPELQPRAVILGSGCLFDVPIDEISSLYSEVILVDAVHLRRVRRRTMNFSNVKHFTADISGICEDVFEHFQDKESTSASEIYEFITTKSVSSLPLSLEFLSEPEVAFIASVNILSQLPVGLCAWIERHSPHNSPENILDNIRFTIQSQHFTILEKALAPRCIVSDVELFVTDKTGCVQETSRTVLIDFPISNTSQNWNWNIAPAPELHAKLSAWLAVRTCTFGV